MDAHVQRLDDALYRVPFRLCFAGEGFIKAFPVKTRVVGKLGNASVSGDMAQRNNEHIRIFIHEGLGQILANFLVALEKIKGVVGFSFSFHLMVMPHRFLANSLAVFMSRC